MSNYIVMEENMAPGIKLTEEIGGRVRSWKVKGKNKFWGRGWDIKEGRTTRLIFPEDFTHYRA